MWDAESETVRIPFSPDASWCGYNEVVHGGLLASVLDEGMAWVIKHKMGRWAFTVDFQLRYKKPVAPGRKYEVVASADDVSGRKIQARAEIQDESGLPMAVATAVFLPAAGLAVPRSS